MATEPTSRPGDGDVAAAVRELAFQVDTLGDAVLSAGKMIADAIKSTNTGGTGVSDKGVFT